MCLNTLHCPRGKVPANSVNQVHQNLTVNNAKVDAVVKLSTEKNITINKNKLKKNYGIFIITFENSDF